MLNHRNVDNCNTLVMVVGRGFEKQKGFILRYG